MDKLNRRMQLLIYIPLVAVQCICTNEICIISEFTVIFLLVLHKVHSVIKSFIIQFLIIFKQYHTRFSISFRVTNFLDLYCLNVKCVGEPTAETRRYWSKGKYNKQLI